MILKAIIRDKTKKSSQPVEKEGFIPAVVYGEGIGSVALAVNTKEFQKVYGQAGESSLVELQFDKNKYQVLIHQTAHNPLTGEFIHVDFFKPSTKRKVEAEIPLVFEGESLAVKDLGGVLVRELEHITVKGLAHELPREIIINLNSLSNIGDKITVKNLNIPENIETKRDLDDIVVHIAAPSKVEEVAKPTVEAGVEGEEAEGDQEKEEGKGKDQEKEKGKEKPPQKR